MLGEPTEEIEYWMGSPNDTNKKNCELPDLFAAITSFYMLEELESVIPASFDKKLERIRFDVENYREEFNETLANMLFDYLALICWGEARYCKESMEYWSPNIKRESGAFNSRSGSYSKALDYDPKLFLPKVEKINTSTQWSSGPYGGERWGRLAKLAGLYYKLNHKVFIDQVVNVSHNGGLAFNKGVILFQQNYTYEVFLDFKARVASLFAESPYEFYILNRPPGHYSCLNHPYSLEVYSKVYSLLERAVVLGLLDEVGGHISITNNKYCSTDLKYSPVKWGSEDIELLEGSDVYCCVGDDREEKAYCDYCGYNYEVDTEDHTEEYCEYCDVYYCAYYAGGHSRVDCKVDEDEDEDIEGVVG